MNRKDALEWAAKFIARWPKGDEGNDKHYAKPLGWHWGKKFGCDYWSLIRTAPGGPFYIDRGEWTMEKGRLNLLPMPPINAREFIVSADPAIGVVYMAPEPGKWYINIGKGQPVSSISNHEASQCVYASDSLVILHNGGLGKDLPYETHLWDFVEAENPDDVKRDAIRDEYAEWLASKGELPSDHDVSGVAEFVLYRTRREAALQRHLDGLGRDKNNESGRLG